MGFVSTDSNALGKEAGHISKLNNFSKVILICFLRVMLLCVHVCVLSRSVVSDSLQPHGLKLVRLLCPWNSPGKDTGVGCHSLLQGIFPTQGSNLGLLHCKQILYHVNQYILEGLSHDGTFSSQSCDFYN